MFFRELHMAMDLGLNILWKKIQFFLQLMT